MITENTVFILGAGASKPYGFPTALELRKDIIYSFTSDFQNALTKFNQSSGDNLQFSPAIKELIETFRLSSTKSIDLFLSRNKKYYELGKAILAFLIASTSVPSFTPRKAVIFIFTASFTSAGIFASLSFNAFSAV